MSQSGFVEHAVIIAGREYKLRSPLGQEQALQEAAALFNSKILEVKSKFKGLNTEQAAVLAGLNLSHDYLAQQQQAQNDQQLMEGRIAALRQAIEASLVANLQQNPKS